jgi:hypothetical protein
MMKEILRRLVIASIGAVFVIGGFVGSPAHGAQINAFLVPEHDEGHAKFMGLKFIQMKYPRGSPLAEKFEGTNKRIEFTAPLQPSELDKLNRALLESNSPMQLSNASVAYAGTVRGSHDTLILTYRLELDSQMYGYVLNQSSNSTETILIDSNWRGFIIHGPVMANTDIYGEVNVNEPIGLVQAMFSNFAWKLMDADAETRTIMTEPILDFGDIGKMPLEKWHLLFDPTFSQASVKGVLHTDIGTTKVLSVYSLGECSIREGCPEPREADSTAIINGTDLKVHISTPQPNAQIEIAGYTTIQRGSVNGDLEIIRVSLDNPGPSGPPPFTMQVLLVLAGMMAAVAGVVLYKARK